MALIIMTNNSSNNNQNHDIELTSVCVCVCVCIYNSNIVTDIKKYINIYKHFWRAHFILSRRVEINRSVQGESGRAIWGACMATGE